MVDREKLLAELIEIGIALTNERDLYALLDRILAQARPFTRAAAGTPFLRDGEHLRCAVVQNDFLERKLGKHDTQRLLQDEPLRLSESSLALRSEEEVKRHTRFGHPLSLVVLNVDHFKKLNEEHGRTAGDEVLREVARLLVKHSRSFTIISRQDGDDFAALLANTPKAGAVTYAQRIRGLVAGHAFATGANPASL